MKTEIIGLGSASMNLSLAEASPDWETAPPVDTEPNILERFSAVSRGLYRYVVVRLSGDSHGADDILQQTWLAVSGERPRADVADWEGYLRGIARNLIRQHWKHRGRTAAPIARPDVALEVATLLDAGPLPSELLQRKEAREQVLLALTLLDAADQELIIRHHFRGQSQQTLADDLKCGVRAVEGRLYRARRQLRDLLSHLDPNEAS